MNRGDSVEPNSKFSPINLHTPNGALMKLSRLLFVPLVVSIFSSAHAADGMIAVKSPRNAKETMNRFEELAKQRGLNVFEWINRVDQ